MDETLNLAKNEVQVLKEHQMDINNVANKLFFIFGKQEKRQIAI